MQSSEQEIHSEICNQDAQEGEDAEDMEMLRISEPFQRSLMDAERINEVTSLSRNHIRAISRNVVCRCVHDPVHPYMISHRYISDIRR